MQAWAKHGLKLQEEAIGSINKILIINISAETISQLIKYKLMKIWIFD